MSNYEYNPGSPEAIEQGCTCPVLDNGRGKGSYKGDFIISERCPVHDYPMESKTKDTIE